VGETVIELEVEPLLHNGVPVEQFAVMITAAGEPLQMTELEALISGLSGKGLIVTDVPLVDVIWQPSLLIVTV
jgi:hypothetical protein